MRDGASRHDVKVRWITWAPMADGHVPLLLPPSGLPSAHLAGRLALFDLDRTLVPGSSLMWLGRELVAAKLLPRRRLVVAVARNARFARKGAGDVQVARFREHALSAIAGLDYEALLHVARRAAARVVEAVPAEAKQVLDEHRQRGDRCVLVSASPHEFVDLVARGLGAERGIGTRGEVRDGRCTGRLDGPFCYGPGKLARLRDELGVVDLRRAHAYADSASDLPLLEACGHPVAVNPDRRMRAVASEQGWPVLQFAA